MIEVTATDYHTEGEPFRIVAETVPWIGGSNTRERRDYAAAHEEVDRVRRLLCHEPRGHADMYGCFVVEPDDSEADFGALFWHKDGYSTACGHGTIALGAWAVETGRVKAPRDGHVDVTIDVPSRRVVARVECREGIVASVGFRNVPAYVVGRGVQAGDFEVDIAFGGALYAFLPAERLGLRIVPDQLSDLIATGRAVKESLRGHPAEQHMTDDRLSGIYGVALYEDVGPLHRRNVVVFADGQVDRSPTGSATSAVCALLCDDGVLHPGGSLRNDSIIGTSFLASVLENTRGAVLTEVKGTSFRTGEHRFVLIDEDPLGTGFVLR